MQFKSASSKAPGGERKAIMNKVKSGKLIAKPILFSFDIFVRAATEIQRVFRGHRSRLSNLRARSFNDFRDRLIRLQRFLRKFLTARRIRYKQFSDYLQKQSKKIVLNLKHFYKINSKFNKMRSYLP